MFIFPGTPLDKEGVIYNWFWGLGPMMIPIRAPIRVGIVIGMLI